MKVYRDRVVSIDYAIRLASGEVVESSAGVMPLLYLHGRAQLVPSVERAIEGHEEGSEFDLELSAAEAYGEHDPDGVFLIPRSAFPDDEQVEVGMTYSAVRGDGKPMVFRVVRASGSMVLVDANHPLAGKALRVWVAVRTVRDATSEELVQGRVHPEVHDTWVA